MSKLNFEDLAARLDLIQQSLWSIEEKVVVENATIGKQQVEMNATKSSMDLVHEKLDKIEAEMRALRNNGIRDNN